MSRLIKVIALGITIGLLPGCLMVPQNRRGALADPIMQLDDDALETQSRQKLYTTREGAARGDGATAGGGCACQ